MMHSNFSESYLFNAYLRIQRVSLNLIYIDFTLNMTIIIDSYSLSLNMELKHGPADGVTPVFTPTNPYV